ncbi:MAG: RDD family protein [Gemmatimonadales bacterium]
MDLATQGPLYATFARRVRAMVLDGVVLAVLLCLLVYLASTVHLSQPLRLTLFAAVIGLVFLYEPVLVTVRGSTVGQQLCNLRVVAPTATGRLPFWKAFLRWVLKAVTGFASFATMGATRRNQALHDLPFGTTVQIANPGVAGARDYILERPETARGPLPSRWRRVVVIAAYVALLVPLVGPVTSLGAAPQCIDGNVCGPGEKVWVELVATAWLATLVAVCIFGWKGRLPGAQRGDAEASVPADPGAAT